MQELLYNDNIFEKVKEIHPVEERTIVVTTNGMVKKNGNAVMGRGIAKYAEDNLILIKHPGIPKEYQHCTCSKILGKLLSAYGNHAYYLGTWQDMVTNTFFNIITMPTKNDWRNPSDIQLIEQSCKEIVNIADKRPYLKDIFLPAPGCNCGKLSWEDVYQKISPILDDRFICVHPDSMKLMSKEKDENNFDFER